MRSIRRFVALMAVIVSGQVIITSIGITPVDRMTVLCTDFAVLVCLLAIAALSAGR